MADHRRARSPRVRVALLAAGMVAAASGAAVAITLTSRSGDPRGGQRPVSDRHHGHPATSQPSISPGVPADRVLRGDQAFPGGFTVPAGQVWEFAPDTSTTAVSGANVVVEGVLRMRPADPAVVHTLRFTGIDERRFVGGGMTVLATDVGLWVMGAGQLDLSGSPKAGWNRTGTDPSWRPGDDIRVAPTARGDSTTFARFVPGSAVPAVTYGGRTYAAEVLNLTRNVRVEGTGDGGPDPRRNGRAHVFILSARPQSIRYAELRHLAPRKPATENPTESVLGRYALHFHMAGNGSRGSLVEGVVVRDSGGHAFVPHASHGITLRDTIAFNTFDHAYWWDPDEEGVDNSTHDLRIDHAMAAYVRADPPFRGYTMSGFMLGSGRNLTVTGSVGVGVQGNVNSSGFFWPGPAGESLWTFTDNVAHNNSRNGAFVWQNNGNAHLVAGLVAYRNGNSGVEHGAYDNCFRYQDLVLFENGREGILSKAGGGRPPQRWQRVDTDAITIGHHVTSAGAVVFDGLVLRGTVTVDENEGGEGRAAYEFRNVRMADGRELTRADFVVKRRVSTITVYRADGTSFQVA